MGNNFFQQFDESEQNILSDSAYLNDSQRQNGFSSGVARSELFNKVLEQSSSVSKALGNLYLNTRQDSLDASMGITGAYGELSETNSLGQTSFPSIALASMKHRKGNTFIVPIYKPTNATGDSFVHGSTANRVVRQQNMDLNINMSAYYGCELEVWANFCVKYGTDTYSHYGRPGLDLKVYPVFHNANSGTEYLNGGTDELTLYNNMYTYDSEHADAPPESSYVIRWTRRKGYYYSPCSNGSTNFLPKYKLKNICFWGRQEYMQQNLAWRNNYLLIEESPEFQPWYVSENSVRSGFSVALGNKDYKLKGFSLMLLNSTTYDYIIGDVFAIVTLHELIPMSNR